MLIKSAQFITSAVKPSQYPEPSFPEVAFAGRSNVGKSSLLNILVNRKNLVKTSKTLTLKAAVNPSRPAIEKALLTITHNPPVINF